MKKVIGIVALLLLLLVIAVGVVWHQRGRSHDRTTASSPSMMFAHGPPMAIAPEASTTIPAWLARSGASPRRIAGRVVFRGIPIGGAKVELGLEVHGESMPALVMPDSGPRVLQAIAEVTSAADGTFDFGVQPPVLFTVSATAANFAGVAVSFANFDPRATPDQLVLALGVCRTRLSGTIADASGGGIAKARIYAAGLSGTESDATGAYSVCLAPRHAYGPPATQVRVEADGYGTVRQDVIVVGDIRLDFKLVPEAILAGHVTTGDGQPVAGARVIAAAAPVPFRNASGWTTSDRDGTFRIVGLAPGAFNLLASAEGLGTTAPIPVVASAAATSREIKVVLAPLPQVSMNGPPVVGAKGAIVRGRVTRGGVPIEGADVMYMGGPQTTLHSAPPVARSDANGEYVLEGVPPGPGRFSAIDYPSKAFSEWVPIDVGPGDDKTIDLDLTCAGEVMGTVVDQTGGAVAGVYVRMDIPGDFCEAMTDTKGQFDCALLYGGMYQPTVAPLPGGRQGFAPARGEQFELISVPKDGVVTGVTIAIKHERVAIRGNVVDDAGVTMTDVYIEAVGRGESTMDSPSTMSDTEGRFEIGNLARGVYALRARAADGSETEVRDVAAGGESVTVKLARAGAIDGILVGFSKPPEVFALQNVPGGHLTRALVDGEQFSSSGLAPGRYTIEAQIGAEVDAQPVEIRPGETVKVTLRNRGAGSVEGTVSDLETHAPLAGLRCDAKPLTSGQTMMIPPDVAQQAFTDAAGHYVVSAPIGRVRIFCAKMNGELRSAAGGNVEVTKAGTAKLDAFSVRGTFGDSPGDAGFRFDPLQLPVTVGVVFPQGSAATAGLRVGDQVVAIDGVSLQGLLPDGAVFLLVNHRPGTVVTLDISRGGTLQSIKIPVGKPQM